MTVRESRRGFFARWLVFLAAGMALTVWSAAPAEPSATGVPPDGSGGLSDLTLGNFFTAGWDEPWRKRPHPDGAPDLTLLKVQSNLLLYSVRTDSFYERTTGSSRDRNVLFASQLFEYSLNRRLMLAAFANYQWVEGRTAPDRNGAGFGALTRWQLVDLPRTSYALNVRVAAPNDGLGERQTLTSAALAGWHDLSPLGLGRTGLYWHVQEETWIGPHLTGVRQNDVTYDLSLARTWSRADALLGNFSTFLETYARTDLDGRSRGRTVATLTPGFRFTVDHHHVVMAGLELPVSTPRPYDLIARFTYIYSF